MADKVGQMDTVMLLLFTMLPSKEVDMDQSFGPVFYALRGVFKIVQTRLLVQW